MKVTPPRPMKATAGELPSGEGWWYEIKWDGMRLIVSTSADTVGLTSANGNDATVSYPELQGLGAALGVRTATLDGEVVVFDAKGRPSFEALQHRMHVHNPREAAERAAVLPAVLCLFDLLELDGNDLTGLPLTERRRVLEALVEPAAHWRVPDYHEDGQALLAVANAQGLEGVVAKRLDSNYRPGARTREWIKVKVRRRQEFVVGGWAPGTGSRGGGIGGLLIGYHPRTSDGRPSPALRYAGRVGSGISDQELADLLTELAAITTDHCPFDAAPPRQVTGHATWVEPAVVVEVAFAHWTRDGVLRHPTYAGRRPDVDAVDVTAEP